MSHLEPRWEDKHYVLFQVNQDGNRLEFACELLKSDEEVVLTAVENFGGALEFVSQRLRDDKEIVGTSVENHGKALEFASQRLRDDKNVVLEATDNDDSAWEFASMRLRMGKKNYDHLRGTVTSHLSFIVRKILKRLSYRFTRITQFTRLRAKVLLGLTK